MTGTLDDRILAELDAGWPFSTRVYALQKVIELHAPNPTGQLCMECLCPDPCVTKQTIARELGLLPPAPAGTSAGRVVHIRHTDREG